MKIHGLKALAAALLLYAAGANAQGAVTLVCSGTPDGPVNFQIEVNYEQSTVNFMTATHQAQISEKEIVWQTARIEERGGRVGPAVRYTLDRITGQLRNLIDCLPRDSSWGCTGFSPISYCKPGKKMF